MALKKELSEKILLDICDEIQSVVILVSEENKRKNFGDQAFTELLLMKKDKISVSMNKEKTNHHEPHIHIKHSDKINATMNIRDFSVLAGKLDQATKNYLFKLLESKQSQLLEIWSELNDKDNSIEVHKMVKRLGLK